MVGTAELEFVFAHLRGILAAHASEFAVAYDEAQRYGLEAPVGQATMPAPQN